MNGKRWLGGVLLMTALSFSPLIVAEEDAGPIAFAPDELLNHPAVAGYVRWGLALRHPTFSSRSKKR
jgi:hypothetical protein